MYAQGRAGAALCILIVLLVLMALALGWHSRPVSQLKGTAPLDSWLPLNDASELKSPALRTGDNPHPPRVHFAPVVRVRAIPRVGVGRSLG
jgi:hypothetical protein